MTYRLPIAVVALALLLGGAETRAQLAVFEAPENPTDDSIQLVAACGVSAPGQPVVGRFGFLPPPPLKEPELPASAFLCQETASGSGEAGHAPMPEVEWHPHCIDPRACELPCSTGDFSADAFFAPYEICGELGIYNGKSEVPVQRPLIEWGQPFYGSGPTPLASEVLSPTNLVIPKFYVFGDYRVGYSQNDLVNQSQSVLAHRLNLEVDLWITSTERIHGFIGPLQKDARFMRLQDGKYFEELDFFQAETDTLFFEGDFGHILGGIEHTYAPFDLPFTFGLVPLLFQNGIWTLDAMVGGAVTLPAKASPRLDWSNFDVTFFAGFDRISSGAFGFDEDSGQLVGAHTFIESRGGYLEAGYAFVEDVENSERSYHNIGISYTRRYANLISNSVRVIVNAGQDTGNDRQTADGVLLLVENTFLTKHSYNWFPYANFFAGFDRPQPLARAGAFGGVLFNSGILFQSDALTGYPTLDASGNNTFGAAVGIDVLAPGFDQQLILEAAALGTIGDRADRIAPGNQVGVGMRWQRRLSEATILRADAMIGWLDNSDDISGARIEYRWKF